MRSRASICAMLGLLLVASLFMLRSQILAARAHVCTLQSMLPRSRRDRPALRGCGATRKESTAISPTWDADAGIFRGLPDWYTPEAFRGSLCKPVSKRLCQPRCDKAFLTVSERRDSECPNDRACDLSRAREQPAYQCESYDGCTKLGQGAHGRVCLCKPAPFSAAQDDREPGALQGAAPWLRKIAFPGAECELGDELRAMHKLLDQPCFAKPLRIDAAELASLREALGRAGSRPVVRARRTILMRVVTSADEARGTPNDVLTLLQWSQTAPREGRGRAVVPMTTSADEIICRLLRSSLELADERLLAHDHAAGNVIFSPAALEAQAEHLAHATGQRRYAPAPFASAAWRACPAVFIDLPEYFWRWRPPYTTENKARAPWLDEPGASTPSNCKMVQRLFKCAAPRDDVRNISYHAQNASQTMWSQVPNDLCARARTPT